MKTTTIAIFAAAAALCAVSPTLADWLEQPVQDLPDGSHLYQIGENWEYLEQQGGTTAFGTAVAANETLLVVGAPYAQAPADQILMGLGVVSVYEYTDSNPTVGPDFAGIILCPSNSWGADTTTAHFGWSVALWHNYIAIGAPYADHGGLSGVGLVYIYHRNDLSSPTQMLIAQASSAGGHLGWSLAFHNNGDLLAGSPGSNSVLHFERDNVTWNLTSQIDAPAGTVASAQFGASVDSFLGEVLIGAPQDTTSGQSMCGQVSIAMFDNDSGTYIITSTFAAPTPTANMAFGSSVCAGAGNYFVVGAPRDGGNNPGEAYVYRHGQTAPISTLVPELSHGNDYFGYSVAMTTGMSPPAIAVGSPGATDDGNYSGAVVIFELSQSTDSFVESARLNGYLAATDGNFGDAVAFRNGSDPEMLEHRTLLAGAPGSEVAYSFFSHDPLDSWVEDTRWPIAVRFPNSVDADGWDYDTDDDWPIATDGERLVVSEGNAWANENEVRIYLRTAGDWVLEHTYAAPSTASSYFGFSVAVDNNMVLIGDPDSDNGSGDVYYGVFSDLDGWSTLDTIYRDGSSVAFYGSSVAIELDSAGYGWIAVGELGDMFNSGAAGTVHLSSVASWYTSPYTTWTPNNLGAYDDNPLFGSSLDIDNGRVLIGAPFKAVEGPEGFPCYQGAAYLYEEVNGAGWQNTQYIPNPADIENDCGNFFGMDGGSFGVAVALTGDVIVIGVPRASASEILPGSGLVFTYSASDGSMMNVVRPMDLQPGDGFGTSIDADGNTIIAGAPGSDFNAVNGGAAWHFAADTGLPSEALMLEAPSNGASLGSSVAISVSGSGKNVELLMLATALGQDMPNDRLGAVATFTSGAVANWIERSSGGALAFDANGDHFWSMPPEDAAVLRFSRWLGGAFEIWLDELTTDGASIEVFIAAVALKDSSFPSFAVDGDVTVAGPAELGRSRLEISFLSPFDIWGATNIGGNGATGSLLVRGSSHVAAHSDFNLHGGASLAVQSSYDDGLPIIDCVGSVSLGGTCTVIDAPLLPTIGDRIVLLQATVAPPAGQDSFDMVTLPSLPGGMAFQLLYETVPTVQGTVWQVVVEIVDFADLIGFGEGGSYAVAGDPVDMVLSDLNGDGADEICVLFGGSPGDLYIFENDGSGGIAQQIIIAVGDGPVDLAAGNIDGASGNDLLIANAISSNLTLLFNDGDFTDGFTNVTFSLTDSPSCIAAINIDGDGLDDLVVGFPDTDADGNGRVELYYGASSLFGGGLAGGGGTDVPGSPFTLDPSEEEDQKAHLFYGATNTGQAMAGRMDTALAGPILSVNSMAVGTGLSGVANGDIDGDGDEDMIISAEGSDQVIFLLRDGATWTFDDPLYMPMGTDPGRVIAEDLNGDGTIDIATLTTNDAGARVIRVLQNDGNNAWTSIDTADGDNPAVFAAGDVTGNGSVDLITVTAAASSLFGPIQEVAVRPVNDMCPGDIDGNGAVNVDDLMALIGQWGNDCEAGDTCTADLDGNLTVDVDDLVMLIGLWGNC